MSETKRTGVMDKGSWMLMILAFVFGLLVVMTLCNPRRTGGVGGVLRVFGVAPVGGGRLVAVLEDGTIAVLRSEGATLIVEGEYTLKRIGGRLLAEQKGGQEAVLRAQKELFERFCRDGKLEAAFDVARQLAKGAGLAYLQEKLKEEGVCGDVAAIVLGEHRISSAGTRLLKMLEKNRLSEKVIASLTALTGKTPPEGENPLQFYKNLIGEEQ